jgi:autotransporter-associated beta strand protein
MTRPHSPSPLHLTRALLLAGVLLPVFAAPLAQAAELTPSGIRANNDWFGNSVGISGDTVYVGANLDDDLGGNSGTVSVYRNISTATGTVTETAKLYSAAPAADDNFGTAISMSGNNALVTSLQDDSQRGSAYVVFNIDSATPTLVKLAPAASPYVGRWLGASASLSGNAALIGTSSEYSGRIGEAFLYRNIDTTIVETRLTSPEVLSADDRYGASVALAGDIALVGAPYLLSTGAVFMYQNLASATPVETKILAFDGDGNDSFGWSLSISGTTALVGARSRGAGFGNDGGAAYVIRNLDTTQVQTKLVASDAQFSDQFGAAVSLSGNTALVGADSDDGVGDLIPNSGSAYLFFNVDSGGANATVTEDLKIFASNSAISAYGDKFGSSVAIDGDNFVVGAYSRNSGRGGAYTGSLSSMTTLDTGNTTRSVSGLSFISRGDWIIGQTTDGNTVQFTSGDTANVTASGKAVYIGKNAGTDNNTLLVSGTLTANEIHIGSADNAGNKLQIGAGGTTGEVVGGIINHGDLTFNRSDSSTHGNQISGTGTVTKLGAGTITLTANNTYTGATAIDGGKLVVDGSLSASSAVAINSGGTLGGHGTVGAVTINSGGTISPGNSPGTMNSLTETWNGGGTYVWELNDATGTKGATSGTGWDWLSISGGLTIASTELDKFTIQITSLGLDNLPGNAVNVTGEKMWVLATASGGITGFDSGRILLDVSHFTNDPNASRFSLSVIGNDLILTYTAIPEPSTYATGIAGLLVGIVLLRRRRVLRKQM